MTKGAMIDPLNAILAQSEGINLVLLIGLAILAGTVGAKIIKTLHIPQIIGYIAIGVILGPLLKVIPLAGPEGAEVFNLRALEVFNLFALGVIGFLIGGELERDIFVKFGKQVIAILLFEGGLAFVLVGTTSFFALNYFYPWQTALAVGVVFGAICAATDPASTMNVLWEYKTRGPLTTMLTAVVALDDALALVLYITSVSLAGFLTGTAEAGFFELLFHSVIELAGSLALGFATGLGLREIVKRIDDDEKMLVFSRSLQLDKSLTHLEQLLEEVVRVAKEDARRSEVALRIVHSNRLRPLNADPMRLEQALLNLVVNAVQASASGEVVTLRAIPCGGSVAIEVSDRGEGIPEDKRSEILAPFYTTKKEGTGLGLPIVKKIVEAHAGRLEFADNPDKGVTFRIILPKN